jgi:FtsP/CotA-like multicopper oxidase with cupredoxin domain
MPFSRRDVFTLVLGLSAFPAFAVAETTDDGFQVLRARPRQVKLLEGDAPLTAVWSFGEAGLPVAIAARQGAELKLRFVNELDHEIWLHWFGVRGPSELMTLNAAPGEANAVDCVFTPPDAGTFWLGPMADISRTREMSLYAVLVVAEADAATVQGIDDLAVVVDDWKIDDSGVIIDDFGDMHQAVGEGRLGNWFTLNSQYRPALALSGDKFTRLRLLNAANVRVMNLQFKGDDPLVIALDGQPVRPHQLGAEGLVLAPGQRADILVQGSAGGTTLALDLFEDVVEIGTLVAAGHGAIPDLADNFALPPNPITTAFVADGAQTVALLLEGGEKGGMTGARLKGEARTLRELLEAGYAWAVNGEAGPGGPPLATFTKGASVVLAVDNRTAFDQPLHIHGHVWQLAELNGAATSDQPWRDTAVIPAHAQAKLVFVADNPGSWAIQSLVAERSETGLIVGFSVT